LERVKLHTPVNHPEESIQLFIFAVLSYAVVSMKNISVEVVSVGNSEVKKGAFR
jgi:hypothetical protein